MSPASTPARRLRYVGYLRGAHRVVCEVEHCGALLPLAEGGQAGRRPPNLDTSVQGASARYARLLPGELRAAVLDLAERGMIHVETREHAEQAAAAVEAVGTVVVEPGVRGWAVRLA